LALHDVCADSCKLSERQAARVYIFQVFILVQRTQIAQTPTSAVMRLCGESWAQAIDKRIGTQGRTRQGSPFLVNSTTQPHNQNKPLLPQEHTYPPHTYPPHSQHTMARTRSTTTAAKPSLMDRLTGKKTQTARVTESTSRNPLTGTTTTTRKTTTHPSGVGHHGHAGKGPLATKSAGVRGTGAHGPATTSSRTKATGLSGTQHRKPTMGDKVAGTMTNLKGSLLGKPGVKVSGCVDC
jgi:hypothetical protein